VGTLSPLAYKNQRGGNQMRGAKFWRMREEQKTEGENRKQRREREDNREEGGAAQQLPSSFHYCNTVKKKENSSTGWQNHCAATPPFPFLPVVDNNTCTVRNARRRKKTEIDRGRNIEQRRRTAVEPPSQQLPLGFPATVRSPSRCHRHQQIIKEEQKNKGKLR
jgi:hypothetical protein